MIRMKKKFNIQDENFIFNKLSRSSHSSITWNNKTLESSTR